MSLFNLCFWSDLTCATKLTVDNRFKWNGTNPVSPAGDALLYDGMTETSIEGVYVQDSVADPAPDLVWREIARGATAKTYDITGGTTLVINPDVGPPAWPRVEPPGDLEYNIRVLGSNSILSAFDGTAGEMKDDITFYICPTTDCASSSFQNITLSVIDEYGPGKGSHSSLVEISVDGGAWIAGPATIPNMAAYLVPGDRLLRRVEIKLKVTIPAGTGAQRKIDLIPTLEYREIV